MDVTSRDVFVCAVVLLLLLSSVLSNSATVSYDPNIECDIAELMWKYGQKLMPSRGTFPSVYDAVNLKKCNISKHVESDPVENVLKKRYISTHHVTLFCTIMRTNCTVRVWYGYLCHMCINTNTLFNASTCIMYAEYSG